MAIPLLFTNNREDSVSVVEDFFAAIEERDVKRALGLVNSKGVPSGDKAAFLKPEAIADGWSLESAKMKKPGIGYDIVTATFDTELGSHSTDYTVTNGDDPELVYPLVLLGVGYSPLQYAQANDLSVPITKASEKETPKFSLFPGTYTFYKDIPDGVDMDESKTLEIFEQDDISDTDDLVVRPPKLSMEPSVVSDIQDEFDVRLAECVKSPEVKPEHCPFRSDDYFTTEDGADLRNLSRLEWKLTDQPSISLGKFDPDSDFRGIPIETDPATPLTLTGTGETRDGESMTFTAKCGVDPETWVVTVDADGETALADYRPANDTGLDTCGNAS